MMAISVPATISPDWTQTQRPVTNHQIGRPAPHGDIHQTAGHVSNFSWLHASSGDLNNGVVSVVSMGVQCSSLRMAEQALCRPIVFFNQAREVKRLQLTIFYDGFTAEQQ